jgi:hypothetical protein
MERVTAITERVSADRDTRRKQRIIAKGYAKTA